MLCFTTHIISIGSLDLVTGFGFYPCIALENSGRQGVIPTENCALVKEAASRGKCICGDLPADAEIVTNQLNIPQETFRVGQQGNIVFEEKESGPYHPIWQATVLEVIKVPIMFNQMSEPARANATESMLKTTMPVLSRMFPRDGAFYRDFGGFVGEAASVLYYPVFDPTDERIVGSITMELLWRTFVTGIFPPKSKYVDVVVENSCGQNYTFGVDQSTNSLIQVGEGDHHDKAYSEMVQSTTFGEYEIIVNFAAPFPNEQSGLDYCRYRFMVFPTKRLEEEFTSNSPFFLAFLTAGVFVFTSLIFVMYDVLVRQRQRKVMASAKRTNDLVSALFPANVRDRLFEQAETAASKDDTTTIIPSKMHMHSFLSGGSLKSVFATEPIADLFPHAVSSSMRRSKRTRLGQWLTAIFFPNRLSCS